MLLLHIACVIQFAKKTCIVRALRDVLYLLGPARGEKIRQGIIISDMLEDCEGKGDARTEVELRRRISESIKEHTPDPPSDVQISAVVVPSHQNTLEIRSLSEVWKEALRAMGPKLTFVGSADELLRQFGSR